MSWRVVVVSSRCKLDLKMGYMVIRGEETKRIYLEEISVLMLENPAISLTGCLLEALVERKIKVIFCDSRRSPAAELVPCHGCHDSPRKLRQQLSWTPEMKGAVWTMVIGEKIRQQAQLLAEEKKQREALLLESYIPQIEFQDRTNREGHAAKVYFNALFGMDFSRRSDDPINAALNYGYAILLSAFNREIAASGYLTELGLHHDNVFNQFNLSSDLMEPFRILVDRCVLSMEISERSPEVKRQLLNILNTHIRIADAQQTVLNAIRIYLKSVWEALNQNDISALCFYDL
ncbi:MAG TPA: type II CRISPR-associated endonuclease Cas1 [Candidatus Faecousia intestinigallinarum]|nr:type II CRISPR-associated endonuclease Cas1 [Candidatus Faecousia intestinigallinarum]